MPKLRRLGPGSWFVPGQNTLHIARCTYGRDELANYGEGQFIPTPHRPWFISAADWSPTPITSTTGVTHAFGIIR